jgi:hypothetical protein
MHRILKVSASSYKASLTQKTAAPVILGRLRKEEPWPL